MIVNSAYMYMGKGVSNLIHLFSNGVSNYAFTPLTGASSIGNAGLGMGYNSSCRFSGVPLQDKTKIVLNLTNQTYPNTFHLSIYTSNFSKKFNVEKYTDKQSEVFEIDIPAKAQIENAMIEISVTNICTFTDIAIK